MLTARIDLSQQNYLLPDKQLDDDNSQFPLQTHPLLKYQQEYSHLPEICMIGLIDLPSSTNSKQNGFVKNHIPRLNSLPCQHQHIQIKINVFKYSFLNYKNSF